MTNDLRCANKTTQASLCNELSGFGIKRGTEKVECLTGKLNYKHKWRENMPMCFRLRLVHTSMSSGISSIVV